MSELVSGVAICLKNVLMVSVQECYPCQVDHDLQSWYLLV